MTWNPLIEIRDRTEAGQHRKACPLSRWPVKHASAQDVDVEMKHALARPRTVVDHRPVSFHIQLTLAGKLRGDRDKMTQQFFVVGGSVIQGNQMLAGYHQKMDWRLRMQVFKGERRFILVHDFR